MGPRSLARVAGDFIAAVQLVCEAPEGHFIDPRALRTNLVRDLERLAKHPLAQDLDPQELDQARFALVAWADERLLQAPWSGREQWSHDLLQLALYRTNRAGDEFYDRLARLGPDQNEARLVFYLCLIFGFVGQLVDDEPARQVLMQRHYELLRAAGKLRELMTLGQSGQIANEAYELAIELEPPQSGTVLRVIARWGGGALLLFGLLWGVLRLLAGSVAVPPGS